MRPGGDYEAEIDGPATEGMTHDQWRDECMMALLYQHRRGGGTFIVFHGRVR